MILFCCQSTSRSLKAQLPMVVILGLFLASLPGFVLSLHTVRFQNEGTGKCLDSNLQGDVYIIPCNGGSYQEWIPDERHKTYTSLRSSRCLDSNGKAIYTTGCNGGEYQRWVMSSFPQLKTEHTNVCLEAQEYTNDLKIETCSGGKYQRWGGPRSKNATKKGGDYDDDDDMDDDDTDFLTDKGDNFLGEPTSGLDSGETDDGDSMKLDKDEL